MNTDTDLNIDNGTSDHGMQQSAGKLATDAQNLIAATADVLEDKVVHARNRLAVTLGSAKQKTIATAKATDQVIRSNPYQAIGIAFVVGAVVGFLFNRRGE